MFDLLRENLNKTTYTIEIGGGIPSRLFFGSKNRIHIDMWKFSANATSISQALHTGATGTRVDAREVIFPLAKCTFDGIQVPCPRESERWLASAYGEDWRTPKASKAFDYKGLSAEDLTGRYER